MFNYAVFHTHRGYGLIDVEGDLPKQIRENCPQSPTLYVKANSLDEVFNKTNDMTIGHPEGVMLAIRSTSVNDVIVDRVNRKVYIVKPVGFVEWENPAYKFRDVFF